MQKTILTIIILSSSTLNLACSEIANRTARLKICDLETVEVSSKKYDANIHLTGRVTGVLSVAGKGGYTLTEDNCSVKVVFNGKSSPGIGDEVKTYGKIKEIFSTGKSRQLIFVETSRGPLR